MALIYDNINNGESGLDVRNKINTFNNSVVVDVNTNTTNIGNAQVDISNLTISASALDTRVTANEVAIAALEALIGAGIDLAALQIQVDTNTANIATNTTDIATLQGLEALYDTRITNNTNAIANNAAAILTNQGNIVSNSSRITSAEGDILTNQAAILTNTNGIAANDADILALQTDVEANLASITAHDLRITQNETDIAANTSAITSNDTDIAALDGRIIAIEDTYTHEPDRVMEAFDYTDQVPANGNEALQVTFGIAQSTADISIDNLGNVTFLTDGTYSMMLRINYGREINNGISYMFARFLNNGSDMCQPFGVTIDGADERVFMATINASVTAGDVMTMEIYRDTTLGNNSGGLYTLTPTLVGWTAVPSAGVVFCKVK